MRNEIKENLIAIPIVAVIGTIIGIFLAGAYRVGIFVPIFFFLITALVGGAIGWIVGLPFHKGILFRTVGAYVLGLVGSYVGIYRATMNEMIRGYRDSVLAINPSLTESEWFALRSTAIPEAVPHAIQRSMFVLLIVVCWIGLYWGVKITIRKILAPSK
jgi:hypothetical protein